MVKIKIFIVIIFLSLGVYANATVYYVSNSGKDSNSGLTQNVPWQTIARVNSIAFKPGDKILFECGGTWRESLKMTSSGTASAYITYGSYGTGAKPRILGSIKVVGWTNYNTNVWISDNTFEDPYSGYDGGVFFEDSNDNVTWGHYAKNSVDELLEEYDWCYSGGNIYIYSASDPDSRYSSVEVSQINDCIMLNDKNFLCIDGFDIRYSKLGGIKDLWPFSGTEVGLEIKNCHVSHIGIKGSDVGYGIMIWHSNAWVHHNEVHDCGRRSITSRTQDADAGLILQNVIIEYNVSYNGYHAQISFVSEEAGVIFRNGYIRHNLVYDSPSQGVIAPEGYSSGLIGFGGLEDGLDDTFQNINVYNNILISPTGYGFHLSASENICFHNNVIFGLNQNTGKSVFAGSVYINNKSHNCSIKNNIFYNDFSSDDYSLRSTLFVESGCRNLDIDYNLYYNSDPKVICHNVQGTDTYLMSDWEQYKAETGWDAHSPVPSDPLFISSSDFRIGKSSAACKAGVNVGILTDYGGNYYSNPPSIGAFEASPPVNPNVSEVGMFIFPNPATDIINIIFLEELPSDRVDVIMYDLTGARVFQKTIEISQLNNEIPIDLSSGVYVIQILSGNNILASQRFAVI